MYAKVLGIAAIAVVGCAETVPQVKAEADCRCRSAFFVEQGRLHAPCGDAVLMRGVNKMVVWTDVHGEKSFPHIKASGANTVRIVWLTQANTDNHQHTTVQDLDKVLGNAAAHGLLAMVELHDSTGRWDLDSLMAYWLRDDVVSVLKKHERGLLLNIGNEVGRNDVTRSDFLAGYGDAIARLRKAGLVMPVAIDSLEWSTNVDFILDVGPSLLAADPLRNVLFSVHAYWADRDLAKVESYLRRLARSELAIVIGELGPADAKCKQDDHYLTVLKLADELKIAWLAWSWGPGNTPCRAFDMTGDNTLSALSEFGEVVVNGPHGLRQSPPILAAKRGCAKR